MAPRSLNPTQAEQIVRRALAWPPRLAVPRYPGGEGERQAAGLIAERLRAAGLAVEEQEFRYGRADLYARRGFGATCLASPPWPGGSHVTLPWPRPPC